MRYYDLIETPKTGETYLEACENRRKSNKFEIEVI